VNVGKGEDASTFGVHETLLCQQSKFFQSALSGDWLESKTRTINLPEHSAGALELYSGWLYNRKICSRKAANVGGQLAEFEQLIQSYVLADMIEDADFADAIIDTIVACKQVYRRSPIEHINLVYTLLPKGSPLRRLLIDMWVCEGWRRWCDECKNLITEVLKDIVIGFLTAKGLDGKATFQPHHAPYEIADRCAAYHQHIKANQPCYLEKYKEGQRGTSGQSRELITA